MTNSQRVKTRPWKKLNNVTLKQIYNHNSQSIYFFVLELSTKSLGLHPQIEFVQLSANCRCSNFYYSITLSTFRTSPLFKIWAWQFILDLGNSTQGPLTCLFPGFQVLEVRRKMERLNIYGSVTTEQTLLVKSLVESHGKSE